MATLTQQEQQVVKLFRSLDPKRWRYVLLEMAGADGWKQLQKKGETKLREYAIRQGLDWDQLNDEQRQDLIESMNDGEET